MPLRPFHLRTAAIVSDGTFIDGYLLGAVMVATAATRGPRDDGRQTGT